MIALPLWIDDNLCEGSLVKAARVVSGGRSGAWPGAKTDQ